MWSQSSFALWGADSGSSAGCKQVSVFWRVGSLLPHLPHWFTTKWGRCQRQERRSGVWAAQQRREPAGHLLSSCSSPWLDSTPIKNLLLNILERFKAIFQFWVVAGIWANTSVCSSSWLKWVWEESLDSWGLKFGYTHVCVCLCLAGFVRTIYRNSLWKIKSELLAFFSSRNY